MINIDYLKKNAPLTITCNEEPGYDDVISCFLMSKLLTHLGVACDIRFASPIKSLHTLELLKKYPITLSNFVEGDLNENKLVVVNSTECTCDKRHIALCVDNCYSNYKLPIPAYICRPKNACAIVILDLMKYYKCHINENDVLCAIVALSDNTFGMKIRADCYRKYDYSWAKRQEKKYPNISIEKINNDCFSFTDFSMTINSIVNFDTHCFSLNRYSPTKKKVKTYSINMIREVSPFEICSYVTIIRNDIFDTDIECGILTINNVETYTTFVCFVFDEYWVSINIPELVELKNKIIPLLDYVLYHKEDINEVFVNSLKNNNIIAATMESCTSGSLASFITDVEGASSVFLGGDITYSNQCKINRGVPASVIDIFSVYSDETASAMAQAAIQNIRGSSFGIGVTGCAQNSDPANKSGVAGYVYIGYSFGAKNIANVRINLSKHAVVNSRKDFKEKVSSIALMCAVALLKYNET